MSQYLKKKMQKTFGIIPWKGLSLVAAVKLFENERKAEVWFVKRRWPEGIRCPRCGSAAIKPRSTAPATGGVRRTPVYHCNGCKFDFSVKAGTVMQGSKLSLGQWGLALYLYSTNLKGVSSMKLHRDLGITQKSAWHLAHRIRETWDDETGKFSGPVEDGRTDDESGTANQNPGFLPDHPPSAKIALPSARHNPSLPALVDGDGRRRHDDAERPCGRSYGGLGRNGRDDIGIGLAAIHLVAKVLHRPDRDVAQGR